MQPVPSNEKVFLSKYFDENTYLVAGKCWRCYEEENEVKIICVNQEFLNQATKYPNSKDISKYKELSFELDDADFLKGTSFYKEDENDQEISESNLLEDANETDSCDSLIEVENESLTSSNLIFHDSSDEQIMEDVNLNEERQNLKDNLKFILTDCNNDSEDYDFISQEDDSLSSLMTCQDGILSSPIFPFDADPFKANFRLALTEKAECDLENELLTKEHEDINNIENMNSELNCYGFRRDTSPDSKVFNGITKIIHDIEHSVSAIIEHDSLSSTNSTAWEVVPPANPKEFEENFEDQNKELSFSGFEQESLNDNILVVDKITQFVRDIEANIKSNWNNKTTENLNLKSEQNTERQKLNFSRFKEKDVNDNILVGRKMNRLIEKIGNTMKKTFKRSIIYENEYMLREDSFKDSFQDDSLVITSKFFCSKENKKSTPPIQDLICPEIGINNLENTYNNKKKSTEFLGFEQEDSEKSNITVSKLHEVVDNFEYLTDKIDKEKEYYCETKYLLGNVIDTIKKEDVSFDEYPTYSKFFPSQGIDPKLESQDYYKNEHSTSFENKKLLVKKNLSRINYTFSNKDEENLVKNENDINYLLTEPIWHPPKSPHNLIEEDLYHNPWALLVATIFLNRTRAKHARDYIEAFLKEYTTPFVVIKTEPSNLEKYFENIGLKIVRSIQVWRMSYDFVYKNWKDVKELYGVGQYGRDAFNMFCLGNLDVEPKDRYLKIYKAWYERIHLKKHVNFNQKFLDAKGYKDDDWFSHESDSDNSDDDNNTFNEKNTMELESEAF